jgi:cytochrome b561
MKAFPPPRVVEVHHPALRTLHWLMAFVIFVALGLGVWSTQLRDGDLRSDVLFVHKSFGVAALALIVLRVLVRLPSARRPTPFRWAGWSGPRRGRRISCSTP